MLQTILPLLQALRPKQWVKSGFVFAPLFFSFQFQEPEAWKHILIAFLSFISLSSAIYIVNDIHDIPEDQHHPVKKNRPIASGKISFGLAFATVIFLMIVAFSLVLLLPRDCLWILVIYSALNSAYTIWLKHVAILDVIVIAFGFVLRVLMGGYAIAVTISPWIILSTFLLALFLGFGKRLSEIRISGYEKKRRSLDGYNQALLDRLISISCGASLMSYALYTTGIATAQDKLPFVYTIAFVVFGLFRYLQILYRYQLGGEPENIIFKDKLFLLNLLAWLVTSLWLLK